MKNLYKSTSHPHFRMVAQLNTEMDREVKTSRPKWITRALSTAVRTECYETALGLAEYALATFGQFSAEDRTKILPWIIDTMTATENGARARHLLLSSISLISESDALFTRFSTQCLDSDGVDPAWATLPSGKLNAYYLAQARFARDPQILSIAARAGAQLRDSPQNNLLIYNHLAAIGRWGEARMFLNKALVPYNVPQVTSMSTSRRGVLETVQFKEMPRAPTGPRVSIIVSAFNAEDTIAYSLRSLLTQTYDNIEILVCDDESNDGTMRQVRDIASRDDRIRVFRSTKQQGPYNIRNELIQRASGELITFHDADDISVPTRIEAQVSELASSPARVATVCRMLRLDADGRVVFFKDNFAVRTCVVSLMFRKQIFDVCGPYRNSRFGADTEFYERARAYFGEDSVYQMKAPLLMVLWSDSSLTRSQGIECTEDGRRGRARRVYSEVSFRERLGGSSGGALDTRRLTEAGVLIEPAAIEEV